jgi:hypothetical protein
MPVLGAAVLVRDLGWTARGVVDQIADDGRTIEVTTDGGDRIKFTLSPATARFTAANGTARLTFT